MTTKYNLKNIRNLLVAGFSVEELRRFSFYQHDFKPVYEQLPENISKTQLVQKLIEYAEQKELFDPLLGWANKQNPSKYKIYQPYNSPSSNYRKSQKSPFIYGRPVRPNEFVNRKNELREIFNRLHNGESTMIIGEPHIGKSSFLLKLADESTQTQYLGLDADRLIFSLVDLQPFGKNETPIDFWNDVLGPLFNTNLADIIQLTQTAKKDNYTRSSLVNLFMSIAQNDLRLVLLLDEFERLLIHPNFKNEPAFFSLLRSLATHTNGLALVPSSRLPMIKLNELGRGLLDIGSPFFNHMIHYNLYPFSKEVAISFLEQTGNQFSLDDKTFILHTTGHQPFLLQSMAAALADTINEQDRYSSAVEKFFEWVFHHFTDLWISTLDDQTRTTLVILSLLEILRISSKSNFKFDELDKINTFGSTLKKLSKLGLVKQAKGPVGIDPVIAWRQQKWAINNYTFVWWVFQVIVAKTHQVPDCNTWLKDKNYLNSHLLTQQQWDYLVTTAQTSCDWGIGEVGAVRSKTF